MTAPSQELPPPVPQEFRPPVPEGFPQQGFPPQGAPQPPAPPRGPGVQPPFPAPPVEGRNRRVAVGVGVGVGAVVAIAVVALVALIGLGTVVTRAADEQMDAVVGGYLDAVRDGRYADAYEQLCGSARSSVSESQFTERVSREPRIADYDVGRIDLTSTEPVVPVDVRYADGSSAQLQAYLEQNTRTGGFEVCSVGE